MHNELKRSVKKLAKVLGNELQAVFWLDGAVVTQLGVALTKDMTVRPGLLLVTARLPELARLQMVAAWKEKTAVFSPIYWIPVALLPGYLQANPALAVRWPEVAHLLWGDGLIVGDLPTKLDDVAFCSDLAAQLYELSLLLVPSLLSAAEVAVLTERLEQLAVRFLGDGGGGGEKTAVCQLAALSEILSQRLDQLPDTVWPAYVQSALTDAPLPGLHALYKTEQERVVLLFDKVTSGLLQDTDWEALADGLGADCAGVQVAEVGQMQLLLARELPLDLVFRRYTLDWGREALTAVVPQPHAILRQAARLPLHVLSERLPQACLLAGDDDGLRRIIHDYQNKLLNVQLEHEILVRLGRVERFVPAPLPDRDAPLAQRIDAIFSQLGAWADFYLQKMATVAAV